MREQYKRQVIKLENKTKKKVIISSIIIFSTLLTLWLTGLIGLWTEGISYIANNTKKFSDEKGYILKGEYLISIDLSDLDSNIGKELYNDGTHKVYVNYIENTGSLNSGGYIIGFRSCGQYSLTNATLISGIYHATDDNSFTSSMSSKMTAEYNGEKYNSSVYGLSGLNYKDGDSFLFYIFPSEVYQNGEITLKEEGIVHLTVTDLYKNIWSEK
jgi:hypothetical protein